MLRNVYDVGLCWVGNINLFSEVFHFFRNDDDDVITLDRCFEISFSSLFS